MLSLISYSIVIGYVIILAILQDQLCFGVRYIDLRVFLDRDTNIKYLVHGFEAGELFEELENVLKFVQLHPGEIVILDMNHIY